MQNYVSLEEVPKKMDEWFNWLRERQLMMEFYRRSEINPSTIARFKRGSTTSLNMRTRRRIQDVYWQIRNECEGVPKPAAAC